MNYILVILVYVIAIIIFGIIMGKKLVKDADDFVVAGRRLPFIILVGTLLATWCGGGGITGSASVVYNYGPFVGILHFLGAPIGILLLYFIAGKVRATTKITVPEIIESRYGALARILSAVCIILAYVGIVATQIKASGNIVAMLTGISVTKAIVISAVVVLLLTVTGGMITVAYSDAVGALVMVGGFALAVPLLYKLSGGFSETIAQIPPAKLTLTGGLSPAALLGYMVPTIALILGDQNMMQRFASAKDSNEAKKSNIGMFVGEIIVVGLTLLIVTAGIVLYPKIDKPANIIFVLAAEKLPFVLGALLLASSVSFIFTTADSFLLSAATNMTYDVWVRFLKKDATDKQKLLFLRLTIVVFTALAVVFTVYFPTIITLQLTAYAMYGAAITPALLFALFSKRVTPIAGIMGILVGGAVTVIWAVVLKVPFGVHAALVSVPASVLAIVITTMLTKHKDDTYAIEKLVGKQG